jgi:histidinol dehydrogenase
VKVERFEWGEPAATASTIRGWFMEPWAEIDVTEQVRQIHQEVTEGGDEALVELAERLDGVTMTVDQIRVDPAKVETAPRSLPDSALLDALELAAANIRAVAEAQLSDEPQAIELPQGQLVTVRDVPVAATGIYAPGGRATYPSSVLMCGIPARVAGVERIALVSPPSPEGAVPDSILAAAALCGINEVYAVGGAQAIFALAFGTETIPVVDMVVGPGSVWVQEAKRRVFGEVGIESYAGPSELMLIAGHDTDARWAAADLCAQAEHGDESPLIVAGVEEAVLDEIARETEALAGERPSVADARLALVQVPDLANAIDLANAFAPEHLELMEEDAARLVDRVATAGCVFIGRYGATAFGDYVAGSNHVLPTTGSGRFAGPLGPGTFQRKISAVEVPAEAAAKLAPYVQTIADSEGFPVHGESAMIRSEET